MTEGVLDRAATVEDLRRALHAGSNSDLARGRGFAPGFLDLHLVVVGAQPNVGASVVATALVDVLAEQSAAPRVRLIDLADRRHSGLLCAAGAELGEEEGGWRLARRHGVTVERLAEDPGLAFPPMLRRAPGSRTVIDTGVNVEQLRSGSSWLHDLIDAGPVVLVCAASVPGVRRAEESLAELPGEPCVVAVGVTRWPTPVLASAGPLLRTAHATGRTFVVPHDKRLAVEGVDERPLSKPVLAAAGRLLHTLTHPEPGQSDRSRKGRNRWS